MHYENKGSVPDHVRLGWDCSNKACGQHTNAELQTGSVDRTRAIASPVEELSTYWDSTDSTMAGLETQCIH